LVVDAFGDADTMECAAAARCLPDAARKGFRAGPLIAALNSLRAGASRTPIGLVLGSGFEDTPRLVATLARHFRLIGNDAETISRAKDPRSFFPLLDALGVPYPETRLDPPGERDGWLSKRIGGSGGAHILPSQAAKRRPDRYFQRRVDGEPVSVLALAGRGGLQIVGFSRQWTVGTGPRPYRYGGAAGPIRLADALAVSMRASIEAICASLALVGLISFDFRLHEGVPYLLEVNPRPGATLDIFDHEGASLLAAHIAACQGEAAYPAPPLPSRAAGLLYAEAGPASVDLLSWPSWVADRPRPGTLISRYRPVATALAEGANALEAEGNCLRRLDELAEMLYARTRDREPNNAKAHRPCPERIGTGSQAR
jgi:predicted ATP-grasp superfamily ATP-dependent carboligase